MEDPGFVGVGTEGMTETPGGLLGEDPSCAAEARTAEQVALDILLMVDISASMLAPLPSQNLLVTPPTKWDAVRASIESFVQAPETADIGVGLQYFPLLEDGVTSFFCVDSTQCGSGGPCSSNYCVVEETVVTGAFTDTFLREAGDGTTPQYCAGDGDCGQGGSCRNLLGQCVFPTAGGVMGGVVAFDLTGDGVTPFFALCETQADCAGFVGTQCEGVGACLDAAGAVVGLCSVTNPCTTAGSTCTPSTARVDSGADTCINGSTCEIGSYATPAVPISSAPDRSDALVASLEAQLPDGLTPTGPALSGALQHAQDWAVQNPGRQVVAILATDGFPTECTPLDIPDVAAIAQGGLDGPQNLRTFIIGVFSQVDLGNDGQANLDALAAAGGTQEAFIVNTGGDVTADFLDALNVIRDASIACDFDITDSAGTLDFTRVNLKVTDPAGSESQLFNVDDVAGCDAEPDSGWYYILDADGMPTQIRVCPGVCETFMAGGGVSAELQIGCATLIR